MNRSRCSYTCGGCGCGSCCNRCTQHSDRRHKKYAGHATTWILTETRRGAVGNMPPAGYSVRGNDRSAAATVPAVQDGCGACCSRCCNRTDDTNKTGHATTRDLSVTRRGGGRWDTMRTSTTRQNSLPGWASAAAVHSGGVGYLPHHVRFTR